MSRPLGAGPRLRGLSGAELDDALEELVVARLKAYLLMDDDEDVPPEQSFFDLGLTSLRLSELRKDLEDELGVPVDATVLFNKPDVRRLVEHLGEVLAAADR